MREYVEIQARKKAHELVLLIFKDAAISKIRSKVATKLKDAASTIAAELFEAHGRYTLEEKVKYLSKARGYLYEVRYYIELLNDLEKITPKSKRSYFTKIDLLDKLLLSMIKDYKRSDKTISNINYFYKVTT